MKLSQIKDKKLEALDIGTPADQHRLMHLASSLEDDKMVNEFDKENKESIIKHEDKFDSQEKHDDNIDDNLDN